MSVTSRLKYKLTGKKQASERASVNFWSDHSALYQQLKVHDYSAIRYLAERVGAFLPGLTSRTRLTAEDLEEIVNDAVFITLKKIDEEQFELKGASIVTYAIAVAKNLVGNRLQKKHVETATLETLENHPDATLDPEKYLQKKEREALLGALLDKLDEPCRQLILLRYYEEIGDEEAIVQKRTPYSNADSLKSQRCKCLKKLAQMAKKHLELFS